MFLRESLWTRFGLTWETAWALWPPGRFRDVMTFLEIQASVQSPHASSGDPDVAQASFEHLREQREERKRAAQDGGERGRQ